MKVLAYIKKIQMWKQCLFGLAASFALTACDGIYDDECGKASDALCLRRKRTAGL